MRLLVTSTAFESAPPAAVRDGLLGWVKLVLNEGIVIEGVQVRRSRRGRLYLSFPAIRDRRGRKRHAVRPLDDAARQTIEARVLDELRRQGRLAS